MKEIVETPHNRKILYGLGAAVCALLLLVGFIWIPLPRMGVKDYEASLAIHMGAGLREESRKDIQEILARDAENLYAHLMLAYVHYETEEWDEAFLSYEESLRICKLDTALRKEKPEVLDGILDTLSRISLKTGRYSRARQYAEERMSLFGENVSSKYIIALSCFSLKDDKSFEENLDQAVEMGIFDPAFKLKLDSVFDNKEMLNDLYLRTFEARAKYEHKFTGKESM